MEREMRELGFDASIIYISPSRHGEENRSMSCEDRTVIDLERYRILKTMRTVLNIP